ncbi:MAG: glyoxalase [Actinomycetota bacterium]|nr:glyoxalase [Actinomycetota bacterium]
MATIESLTIEVPDVTASRAFYEALGLSGLVHLAPTTTAPRGFRGFALGLVSSQPAMVDALAAAALTAGGTPLQPVKRSLWGYGGTLLAPDRTVVSLASSSKKSTGPARSEVDDVVLQLGVADVAASRRFYSDRGFEVTKSFGRRYVELAAGPVSLTLNPREKLAKTMGVDPEASASHGLAIVADVDPGTDPDGFAWVCP